MAPPFEQEQGRTTARNYRKAPDQGWVGGLRLLGGSGKPDAGAACACLTQAVDQGSDYAAGEGDRQRQQPEAAGKVTRGGRP